jgi:hypothetical protein
MLLLLLPAQKVESLYVFIASRELRSDSTVGMQFTNILIWSNVVV